MSLIFDCELGSIGNPNSEWSALTQAWTVAKDCDRATEYLNMSGGIYDWNATIVRKERTVLVKTSRGIMSNQCLGTGVSNHGA